jgi:hypothetical protein
LTRRSNALGKPGVDIPGAVYRVALPRTDVHVTSAMFDQVRSLLEG